MECFQNCNSRVLNSNSFLPARRYANAGTSYGPVSVSIVCFCVYLPQVGVLSKRLNESDWVLAWELLSNYPTLCYKEIQLSLNKGHFPLELCSKLRT